MSDYTIRATPAELLQRAAEIESNADLVRKEVEKISQEIDNLRPTFIGQSASHFLKEFENSRSDMENWDKLVRSFASLIQAAAINLDKADHSG
jgi:WXG100 family type VII secretion target